MKPLLSRKSPLRAHEGRLSVEHVGDFLTLAPRSPRDAAHPLRLRLLIEHHLYGKPLHTFAGRALDQSIGAKAPRKRKSTESLRA